jgi:hypothetical protein
MLECGRAEDRQVRLARHEGKMDPQNLSAVDGQLRKVTPRLG